MKNELQREFNEKGEDNMKREFTEKGENTMEKESEEKVVFTAEGEIIDTSQMDSEEVQLLIEQMMKEAKAREEKLKESLEEIRRELKEAQEQYKGNIPPTVAWANYLDDTLDRISEKNKTPMTPRQKHAINKGIRLITRELTGSYRLNRSNSKELIVLKASADRIADVIAEFGVPEESDPTFVKITEEWENQGKNKEAK